MKCKILMFSLSYTEMFLISDKISKKSKNKLDKISFTDESDFPICSSQRSKNSKEISMSKQIIADSLTCNVHWCLMAHLLNLASSPNIIEKKGKNKRCNGNFRSETIRNSSFSLPLQRFTSMLKAYQNSYNL